MRYAIWTRQTIAVGSLLVLSALFLLGGLGRQVQSLAVSGRATKRLPIYSVQTEDKKIALTLDAAWSAEDTNRLLEIFKAHDAKVTVFAVGDWVRKNPQAVQAFYAVGHELANHSDTHRAYSKLSYADMQADIEACNTAIFDCIGVRPTLVRAPSGDYTESAVTAAEELGMQMVQWSLDSLDWKGRAPEEMTARLQKKVQPGDILLFHNGVQGTPKAIDALLTQLQADGYRFVTVTELLHRPPFHVDGTGRQIPDAAKEKALSN